MPFPKSLKGKNIRFLVQRSDDKRYLKDGFLSTLEPDWTADEMDGACFMSEYGAQAAAAISITKIDASPVQVTFNVEA